MSDLLTAKRLTREQLERVVDGVQGVLWRDGSELSLFKPWDNPQEMLVDIAAIVRDVGLQPKAET